MNTMTDGEMRIEIAEACGWKFKPGFVIPFGASKPPHIWHTPDGTPAKSSLPDYLNDLNACHEMEAFLTNNQRRAYVEVLIELHPLHYTPWQGDDNAMRTFHIVSIDSKTRAIAFLRTIGKLK